MQAYIARRILLIIPTLFLVTLIVFFLVRFIPGSIVDLMVSEMTNVSAGEVDEEFLMKSLGLDTPVHIQYVKWLAGLAQGDLGRSLWSKRSVAADLMTRWPVSVELGFLAMLTGLIIALPVGIYSAIRQDTGLDYLGRTIAILFISVPSFWTATMVIVYPSVYWGWTPPMEYVPLAVDPLGNIGQFVLPAFLMGMSMSGGTMRMTRTMMLEVLRQDYIRTAWSKGMAEWTVITRHALKNALIPVVTIVGMQLPVLIGGAVIIEQIFNLPGVGRYILEATTRRDYTVISGVNLVLAIFIMVVNLIVDLTYAYLDPRIRYR